VKGLRHLHYYNIAHLDLKLKNVLCDVNCDNIVLIDFGLAKILTNPSGHTSHAGRSYRYSPLE